MNIKHILSNIDLNMSGSKTDLLYSALKKSIEDGSIKANTSLPNENEMCEILSIGRGTLREVYKILEINGYLSRSKSGTSVNNFKEIAKKGSFNTSLALVDQADLVEFLFIVEPEACRIAAKNVTESELKNIYEKMILLEKANNELNLEKMNSYNSSFHQAITEACHNPILINSIISSRKKYDEILVRPLMDNSSDSKKFMDLCLLQHYKIYYTLKSSNSDEAYQVMKEHFLTDIEYINNKIESEN